MTKKKDREPLAPIKAAIISIDLVNSTALKLEHDVEQWAACFNFFYQTLRTMMYSCNGQIIKFIGDEVMAIIKDSDSKIAENIETLIYGVERLPNTLSTEFSMVLKKSVRIAVKTAIDYGEVYPIKGISGHYDDYLGTPVDRCARLAKHAKAYATLISQSFMERCPQNDESMVRWTMINIGSAGFKGLKERTCIYQVSPRDIDRLVVLDDRSIRGREMEEYMDYAWLKDIVCHFQGRFVQYQLIAAKRHMAMKDKYLSSRKSYAPELVKLKKELEQVLSEGHVEILMDYYKYLKAYFGNRKTYQPIITFKTFLKEDPSKVTALFRNGKFVKEDPFSISEVTGFEEIVNGNNYYLENNIPLALKRHTYKNRRLKVGAKNYMRDHAADLFKNDGVPDHSWVECWNRPSTVTEGKDKYSTYYKSVLMVPLTIRGCSLGESFAKEIPQIHKEKIYGILSFEHHDPYYFIEKKDTKIAYIFADLHCLHRITEDSFTDGSKTYGKVVDLINLNNQAGANKP